MLMHFDIGDPDDVDKETTHSELTQMEQNHIGFSLLNQRIIFFKNSEIFLAPLPHENMINFIGMPRRRQLLATKRIGDRFLALTRKF